ncbi:MAG: cell division protein SepF [Acidimicrobiia bacterium]
MTTLWRKTLLYLGLVDEEELEHETAPGQPAAPLSPQAQVRTVRPGTSNRGFIPGRRVEPPVGARRIPGGDPDHAEAGIVIRHGVRSMSRGAETEVVVARTFNDAQVVADRLREGIPVVLDLRDTEPDMVRRLIDFASGLTYALEGTMRKVAQGVILVLPARVVLSREETSRLGDLGLYDLPEEVR